MQVSKKKTCTTPGLSTTPVNLARRAFIRDLLGRGVPYNKVVERCQLSNLFANGRLTGFGHKSRKLENRGKRDTRPEHKLYVLRSGTIKRIIEVVQKEICDVEYDRDDEIAKGVERLQKAFQMAAEVGDVGGMVTAQREVNRMLGLKRNGTVSFDVDLIRKQMEEMEAASGN